MTSIFQSKLKICFKIRIIIPILTDTNIDFIEYNLKFHKISKSLHPSYCNFTNQNLRGQKTFHSSSILPKISVFTCTIFYCKRLRYRKHLESKKEWRTFFTPFFKIYVVEFWYSLKQFGIVNTF